jgi:hypothetical protein
MTCLPWFPRRPGAKAEYQFIYSEKQPSDGLVLALPSPGHSLPRNRFFEKLHDYKRLGMQNQDKAIASASWLVPSFLTKCIFPVCV